MEKIEKATVDDIQGYIRDAIKLEWKFDNGYLCNVTYDDQYAYFVVEYYDDGYFDITYRVAYSLDGVNISLADTLEEVKKETTYIPIKQEEVDKGLSSKIVKILHEYFGDKSISPSKEGIPIIKQLDDEEMIAIEPMYCLPGVADGHGEGMDLDTIQKMVKSANEAIERGTLSGGLFHKENNEDIEIQKCWINECPCIIGETEVPEGQPIVKVKFHDAELWDLRKTGVLKGLSIGGKGKREPNE